MIYISYPDNKKIAFFDLDGTITSISLNNTFNFIEMYFSNRDFKFRLILKKLCKVFFIMPLSEYYKRKILINIMFLNLNIEDLNKFTEKIYLSIVKNNFNDGVISKIEHYKKKNYKLIMLTSCTEIPAKAISNFLNFDECICTFFKKRKGKIIGIKEDTFRNFKIQALEKRKYKKNLKHDSIYFTDDPINENNLIDLFSITYRVFKNKTIEMVDIKNE